jgi:hypothetical protein
VAGGRDFEALARTLAATGQMHARFSGEIRTYFPLYAAVVLQTVAAALGEAAFGPPVEAAWRAVLGFVREHFLQGLERAQAARAAEHDLRRELHG